MTRALSFLMAVLILSGSSAAFAFVDQISASPQSPRANDPITVSFRAGECEGVDAPLVWTLEGTNSVRDLIVNGTHNQPPLFCLSPVATPSIVIGSLPPGNYDIHIRFRDPMDGLGGIPSQSFGSVAVTVGAARSIPTIQSWGLLVMVLGLAGTVWTMRRRLGAVAPLGLAVVVFAGMPVTEGLAQAPVLLEVTLGPHPAPTPEDIVEGYDFSTGANPPFAAITVGDPLYAVYLLPARAGPEVSARLQAHAESVRAQLERTLLFAYANTTDRAASMEALAEAEVIESVNIPLDYEFPMTPQPEALGPIGARSVAGIPDWRSQIQLPAAWTRAGGWARIGVIDNGYDTGHPDLLSFDLSGHYTGGNLITADTLDIGRLGNNQTVANCSFPAPSTCDTNLDEMEPVVLPAVNAPCDVTVDDPIADGLMRPWFAGHGSHVFGLVGARHDNPDASKGACPHCGIQPIRTGFERCQISGVTSRVTASSNGSAAGAAITYLTDRGIQVTTMSFANSSPAVATFFCQLNPTHATCRAFEYARINGVVMVAASGNERTRIGFPARDGRLVSVGGVDETLGFWNEDTDAPPNHLDGCPVPGSNPECGSNWTTVGGDPKQEVVVPARQIDSTMYRGQDWSAALGCGDSVLGPLGDGHGPCTGTSMAAPIAAGILGLLRSVNPLLLPGDPNGPLIDPLGVRDILTATTDRSQLGMPWDSKLGYGRTDADAAVRGVLGTVSSQVVKNRATPMFSLYGTTATDYAYSATPQGAVSLILSGNGFYLSSGGGTPGYLDFPHDPVLVSFLDPRANFYVMTTEFKTSPAHPDLIPFHLMDRIQNWPAGCVGGGGCNTNNRDVTLATTVADIDAMVADGFRYFHRQGFIYVPCTPEATCIPTGAERLYRKCNASEDDCAVFLERHRISMEGQGFTQAYPVGSSVVLGYAYPNVDTDGDLLIDGMEHLIGTNPLVADSDGDGSLDGLEFPQGGAPVSDPCVGPSPQCGASPLFANGFE